MVGLCCLGLEDQGLKGLELIICYFSRHALCILTITIIHILVHMVQFLNIPINPLLDISIPLNFFLQQPNLLHIPLNRSLITPNLTIFKKTLRHNLLKFLTFIIVQLINLLIFIFMYLALIFMCILLLFQELVLQGYFLEIVYCCSVIKEEFLEVGYLLFEFLDFLGVSF